MALEHEIKLPVTSLDGLRSCLPRCGASLRHVATFEDNWVLDDRNGGIAARGCLLRVRRWGDAATVTFKGPAQLSAGVKTRQEIETGVADAATLLELFAALGYMPRRRYQKRREEWALSGVTVALDETPMGCFVELEGPRPALAGVAVLLGLDPAHAVAGSYLQLWETFRAGHPEAPADMVFA
jgi:adenylate cyclase, class 2